VRDAPEENVSGLAGDDYVMKPFSLEHLTARIRVVLRRQPGGPA
jgi:two-component system OmpR family response regulator